MMATGGNRNRVADVTEVTLPAAFSSMWYAQPFRPSLNEGWVNEMSSPLLAFNLETPKQESPRTYQAQKQDCEGVIPAWPTERR